MAKNLKLKARKFLGVIPTFAEVTEEKLVEGFFWRMTPTETSWTPDCETTL